MTLLLLVRHAATDVTGKRLTGQLPGFHLSEEGHRQADHAAERLRALPVAAVYSSPLERCRETAGPLARAKGLPVTTVPELLVKWTPLLAHGFAFNLLISVCAMVTGTVAGVALGFARISLFAPVRGTSWAVVQFFRNAPWLVLLFFVMYLLPFEFHVAGVMVPFPDWIKATIGLALPIMANMAEIVRGAVQSIPTAQWEAARSLAFSRSETLWKIILPQCVKRMLPPWMNLYAILTMSTVLASIVGVDEMMTQTQRALSAESRPGLLLAFYSYVLLWFFAYCYPIARWTIRLERKWAVAA